MTPSGTATQDYLRPEFRPSLHPNTILRQVGHESIGWGPRASRPVYLDPIATLLLSIFDGVATNADLADDVCDVHEVEREVAEAHIQRVLRLAADARFLDVGQDHEPRSHNRNLLPEPNR